MGSIFRIWPFHASAALSVDWPHWRRWTLSENARASGDFGRYLATMRPFHGSHKVSLSRTGTGRKAKG